MASSIPFVCSFVPSLDSTCDPLLNMCSIAQHAIFSILLVILLDCAGVSTTVARVVTRGCLLHLRGGGACVPMLQPHLKIDRSDLNAQLLCAASAGHTLLVRCLLDQGAHVNCHNDQLQTSLLLAAEKGRIETLVALVERGAQADAVDNKQSNALHYAAYNRHRQTVEALVEMGASINACNKFGYSPLQYACADGSVETVLLLLSLGADIQSHDAMRWTSLHRAAGGGHAEVVHILLKHGAQVNWRDSQNYTALHEAAWCGHLGIIQMLVAAGADILQTDLWGNSALDLAFSHAREGRGEAYCFLEDALAAQTRSEERERGEVGGADEDSAISAQSDLARQEVRDVGSSGREFVRVGEGRNEHGSDGGWCDGGGGECRRGNHSDVGVVVDYITSPLNFIL